MWHKHLARPGVRWALWALCACPALWLWYAGLSGQLGANPAEALIRGLGDWTLRLLCLTLWVTPLRQAFGWTGLVALRRGLGVWTFVYACQHLLVYAWIDMDWWWSDIVQDVMQRPFILVGVLTWLALLPLAATSFAAAVRWLGAPRWKRLHRLVYGIAGLAVLHFYWIRTGKNHFGEVWLYGGLLALALAWRVWERWRTRAARTRAAASAP